jgi:topoisomerase-4 subunit B
VREGQKKIAEFECRQVGKDHKVEKPTSLTELTLSLLPDNKIFKNYHYMHEYVETMIQNYTYLNTGLTFYYNGNRYVSQKGLYDLLSRKKEN